MKCLLWLTVCVIGTTALPEEIRGNDPGYTSTSVLEDYEYVIVGSGPGGAPLAARLAMAGHKTLLIEAGEDHGDDIIERVPALHPFSSEYEPIRWDFYVQHYADPARQARDSKTTYETPSGELYIGVLYPRAGTLGGCAPHNALIHIYPHEQDWNHMVSLTGDASWSPDNMRTYFERVENAQYLLGNDVVGHGFGGWLTIGTTDLEIVLEDAKLLQMVAAAATAFGKTVLQAVLSTVAGLAELLILDLNAPGKARDDSDGLYQVPITIKDYARNGPRDFVLQVASDGRYPLTIRTNCFVTKVRFDEFGDVPRAVGVDFLDGRSLYRADPRSGGASPGRPGSVNATREVIIAGGTFNTPQLLKLSGVGPRDELASFNIPVIVDLPGVGMNMQDRYEIGTTVDFDSNFTSIEKCTFGVPPDPCLERWQDSPLFKGAYGSNGLAFAAVRKSTQAAPDDPADLLIIGVSANFKGYFKGYSDYSFADAKHFTWLTLKAHSRNRAGTVKLRSADPRDTPTITFNSFDTGNTTGGADDKDLQAVYEGVEFARKIYSSLLPTAGHWTDVRPPRGEAATKQFIKDEAWGHHASCTCSIGADDDPLAVLDTNFKVRGTQGLRVVDASAMPKIQGFFIATTVYMFSEKAADVILADARRSR
ncbi:hypothetical protein C8Q80DRAFT_1222523 [Daedaleopsis nitida]|nr:hypothetical protein C8Q80DRAFT_1222523 [Daedaleopsis nitida]